MKRTTYAAGVTLLIYLFLLPAHVRAQARQDSFSITKDDLQAILGSPNMTLIDLRFGRDWDDSDIKIRGAVREDPLKPGQWIDKYPKDKMLILYCA